jgi:beta-glucosidase
MRFQLLLTLIVAFTGNVLLARDSDKADPARPWTDRSLPPEERATQLVRQMTLDEKILEIHMLDQPEHPREVAGIERLGIPAFRITNGPAGAGPGDHRPTQPATALPAALALAASWDVELATLFGRVTGEEVADRGEHLLEGPGVNITRVPQNGRNFEYFGEDPYLAGRIAVPEIRALQEQRVIAEVKHYAANNQERDRKSINEVIDERTLREIYLPAFEATVKEGDTGAIMAAYPSVNGHFCSENPHLLKDILRGEWGFKGFVQSDYTGTRTAGQAALAGLDLSMRADHYAAEMKEAVTNGQVPEATLDMMVIRRFAQMFRFGMFDEVRTPKPIPAEKNGAISRSIAVQSAVLLKNSGNQLPLQPAAIRTIALIGPYAGAAHTGGGGSSEVKPLYTVSPIDGIKHHLGTDVKVTYHDGANPAAAAAVAKSADVVLVMVGNKDREGRDRPNLSLPAEQDALVSAVAAANPHTIVILKTGGPVLMPWLDKVTAVLEAWYPGEEDGNVVADLVFGTVNPSGKLPMTFPKAEAEVPAHTPEQYPGVSGNALYSEKLLVGYRWYDAQKVAPLFPFGFGLSYTTFGFANVSVSPFTADRAMQVSVDISNTGQRAGAEVVQVYVAAPATAGEPPKQLKGFAKVMLQPGEMRRVTVTLDPRAFSIWDEKANRWIVAPGEHQILVGNSSRNLPLRAAVTIPATLQRERQAARTMQGRWLR